MTHKKFAAFVMTYERPKCLLQTIKTLRAQVFPPEIILIIDNSKTFETGIAIGQVYKNDEQIDYYRVGYNSGPAGAANIGLTKLTNSGYKWIYWGDDDNPPRDYYVFEEMFKRIELIESKGIDLGIIGGKGARINKLTGIVTALRNADLKDKEVAEVDYVPGGQTMIVNSSVIKLGLLPEEKLFFSFEDLDLCLKVKSNGFKIYVDAKTWYIVRKSYNNKNDNYRYKDSSFGKESQLLRNYYSTRSILYILYVNKLPIAFLFQFFKQILKMLIGFKYGFIYGKRNFRFQKLAIIDFLKNNYEYRKAPYN